MAYNGRHGGALDTGKRRNGQRQYLTVAASQIRGAAAQASA